VRNSRVCSGWTCRKASSQSGAGPAVHAERGRCDVPQPDGADRLSEQMAATGFNNQAGAQEFNQGVTNANLNNAGRQQQIQEATYLRNLPLNDIAALLGTGGGVQGPQFSSVSQVGVAAPDYMGQVNNTYNATSTEPVPASAARPLGGPWRYLRAGGAACAARVLGRTPERQHCTHRYACQWPSYLRVQLHWRQGYASSVSWRRKRLVSYRMRLSSQTTVTWPSITERFGKMGQQTFTRLFRLSRRRTRTTRVLSWRSRRLTLGGSTAPVAGGKWAWASGLARAGSGIVGAIEQKQKQRKYDDKQQQVMNEVAARSRSRWGCSGAGCRGGGPNGRTPLRGVHRLNPRPRLRFRPCLKIISPSRPASGRLRHR
jgi:hypothetical protein